MLASASKTKYLVMCVRCVSGDGKRPSVVEVSDTCNTPRVSHRPIFEWTPDSYLVLAITIDYDTYSYVLQYIDIFSDMPLPPDATCKLFGSFRQPAAITALIRNLWRTG